MIRDIVLWPDPILSRPSDPVGAIDVDIRNLAKDMLETMYDAPGRGLAAPQVGVPLQLFVMDTAWKDRTPAPRVMINPMIDHASQDRATGPEACISIPGITAEVERAQSVRLRWTNLEGDTVTEILSGFDAICAQHELDQLNGTVIFDHLDPETRADLEAAFAP